MSLLSQLSRELEELVARTARAWWGGRLFSRHVCRASPWFASAVGPKPADRQPAETPSEPAGKG